MDLSKIPVALTCNQHSTGGTHCGEQWIQPLPFAICSLGHEETKDYCTESSVAADMLNNLLLVRQWHLIEGPVKKTPIKFKSAYLFPRQGLPSTLPGVLRKPCLRRRNWKTLALRVSVVCYRLSVVQKTLCRFFSLVPNVLPSGLQQSRVSDDGKHFETGAFNSSKAMRTR